MADRALSVAQNVFTVVGALTVYAFLLGAAVSWVIRRLREPEREAAQQPSVPLIERRATAWTDVPSWVTRDREWAAAVVLLGSPGIGDRTEAFVDFQARRIDWLGLRLAASRWKRREQMLVEVAYDLAEGQHQPADRAVLHAPVTITDLATSLDEPELDLVHAAVDLRRGARTLLAE